ncbi:hypothetical protein GBA52_001103 [Prunus armeniaca]|nr:hypothetical protein GBA52_001103 [Prunus armeniaca]
MAMFLLPLIIYLTSFSIFFPSPSHAADTLTPSDTLRDNQTLVSAGGVFELGFFSDLISGNHYLGIWFKADAAKVVWVGNREAAILDSSGVLQIRSGNLLLSDRRQLQVIVNSANVASSPNTTATLLDTGNFVLKEANFTKVVVWRGDGRHMDIAFWDGHNLRFIFDNTSSKNDYNFSYHPIGEEDAYYTFSKGRYDLMWFVMASTGDLDQFFLLDGNIWSISHRLCEDFAGGNTGKCLSSLPSICENGDSFSVMNGSLPSTFNSGGWINMGTSDCETLCKSNCSCTAFVSVQNGQQVCQLYYQSRKDLLKIVEKGPGIVYIRGGATSSSDGKNWRLWLAIAVPLASLLVLIPIFSFCYLRCRKGRKDQATRHEGIIHSDQVRLFQMGSTNASPIQYDEECTEDTLASSEKSGDNQTLVSSECGDGANFSKMTGSLPSTSGVSVSSIGISDCQTLCKTNCSCAGFASLQNESTCQLYYGRKQNLLKIIEKGAGLIYIRDRASSGKSNQNSGTPFLKFQTGNKNEFQNK